MKCPDECGKQWKTKQIKLGWQKQKQKEQKKKKAQKARKKEFKKPMTKEKMEIARIVEEKQDKEKDLIEIRTVEGMVPRRLDLREGFVPKRRRYICY